MTTMSLRVKIKKWILEDGSEVMVTETWRCSNCGKAVETVIVTRVAPQADDQYPTTNWSRPPSGWLFSWRGHVCSEECAKSRRST